MLNGDVKRKINSLRDILVGKVPDPKAQVEQITIALIYKFMDDMDLEGMEFGGNREFFQGEYDKYAWTNIMQSENSGQQRSNLYAEGIERMSVNPYLPQLFRDIFRGAYVPYRDPETLNMFLKEINDIKYDNSEKLGNAFEFLLSIMGSQGEAGQFRTPRHIIDMIVEIIDPQKTDSILDPACGTAGFLISAYNHILKNNKSKDGYSTLSADDRKRMTENFAGYDISPDMVRLSRVNMYLHKFTKPQISEYDTLTSLEKWDETFDVIMANPPFMTPKGGIIPHNRYKVRAKRAEVLFVDYIAEHLNPTGKAGIIVPEGIVFQSANAYKALRKYLIKDDLLYAVISLPAGVFNPYSGVKTSILLIDKIFAKQNDKILFVKINNDGFDLGAQRREIKGSDLPEVIRIVKDYLNGKDVSYNELVTVASKKDIAEQDYILVGERYKEAVVYSNDYPMIALGDENYFNIESGGTPSTSVAEYWNGEIKWVTLADLPQGNIISEIIDTERHISNKGLKNSSAKLLPEDTVLISSRATIGRIGIAKTQLATNQGFKNIIIRDKKNVNSKFVALMASKLVPRMIDLASGGTFKEISKSNIATLKIPLPPSYIQEEIVKEIEGYQKIVDGARQVVENYRPSIRIDASWEVAKLGDICELNPKKSEVRDLEDATQVSFVPMADINEHEMLFTPKEVRLISKVYAGYTYFREGDVLLAKVTPCFENGKAAIARNLRNGIGFGSSEFYVLRAQPNKVLPEIIYYMVSDFKFLLKGKDNMTGTGGLQRLTKNFVVDYPIHLPPLAVQKQIVEEVNEEMEIIEKNRLLIELFEQKIQDKISEVWGE
ncbi:N-6 DNA methylase [Alkalibaculum bacchi]|uniref:N-6 DNA methylase n=1 Tax=Alkalibaculum bacchi TaxID=645887 RepID=UPI0026ED56F0|nr:N-6 DNA methylase [Alkalibaculum bacchi]